jgi:hypothetical protein
MKLSGWTKSEQEQGVGGRLLICYHKKIPNNGYCSELAGEYWRIKIFLTWIKLWMVRWPRSKKWRRSSANVEQSEVKWALPTPLTGPLRPLDKKIPQRGEVAVV